MRVVIAGGTGFIGRALVRRLAAGGHHVTVLTRQDPGRASRSLPDAVAVCRWSPGTGAPLEPVDGADAVVNLAGATIARRWTRAAKRLIVDSRVGATGSLIQAIRASQAPPRVLVNASAVGYYGPRGDEWVTEDDPPGSDFLATVCRRWEEAACAAEPLGVRVVLLRTGLVLGRGGALPRLALPFRLFAGGPLGSGRQWMPWIHLDDCAALISFALQDDRIRGPINVTAPNPVPNREFARALGRALGRPAALPVPAPLLRAALGEMADMLLTGQRAVPRRAMALGFQFRFAELEPALGDVLGR
ncbi:MAG: TIGR01777 family protein [Firmicutes bacterium]|nr:TIGR01777 family protein [Bacillota bacterium]